MRNNKLPANPNIDIKYNVDELREIFFAGGCFWGVQTYFKRIFGVAEVTVGYANGKTQNPTYYSGLRYCINSASLWFIPIEEIGTSGYDKFIPLIK